MIERMHWHPVAEVEAVLAPPLGTPLAARLLGEDLVVWRDEAGALHAWPDRCPHRGARFSLGRLQDNRLECAYHGWQFDAAGQCVQVPALPTFVPPPGHRVKHYEVCERHGLVFVRLAPSRDDMPCFDAEDDARLRKLTCGPYDVQASAPRVMENFLDMAHFAFVHEGWLGDRGASHIEDYRIEDTHCGLRATGCKAWQPQSSLQATGAAQVEYSYEVTGPYTAVLTKVPDAASTTLADYSESIGLFVCPVDPERCRVWFRLAVADFESSEEKLRSFQDTIFLQDQPVLESQMPKCLPLDPRAELHTPADRASTAYRRFLARLGITFGVC